MKIRFMTDQQVKDGDGKVIEAFAVGDAPDLPYASAMHWITRGHAVEHRDEGAGAQGPLDMSATVAGASTGSGQGKPSSSSPAAPASAPRTAKASPTPAPPAPAGSSPSTPQSGDAPSLTSATAQTQTGGAPKESTPEAPLFRSEANPANSQASE